MKEKRATTGWTISKLLTMILLVIVLVLILIGIPSGLWGLVEKVNTKIGEVTLLLGNIWGGTSSDSGCFTEDVTAISDGSEFLASLKIEGEDFSGSKIQVCGSVGVCVLELKGYEEYRLGEGVFEMKTGEVWGVYPDSELLRGSLSNFKEDLESLEIKEFNEKYGCESSYLICDSELEEGSFFASYDVIVSPEILGKASWVGYDKVKIGTNIYSARVEDDQRLMVAVKTKDGTEWQHLKADVRRLFLFTENVVVSSEASEGASNYYVSNLDIKFKEALKDSVALGKHEFTKKEFELIYRATTTSKFLRDKC